MKDLEFNITPYERDLIPGANQLRRGMTKQEKMLWYGYLNRYPIKIYRQKVIDRFIADFYCSQAKLVVEIDGGQHRSDEGRARDEERTEILNAHGIEVLRFSNIQVERDFRFVCKEIDSVIKKRIQR